MGDLKAAIADSGMKGSIHKQSRLHSGVCTLLNNQIGSELYSSQLYNYISAYFDDIGLPNLSKLFLAYGKEELTHMYKIYDYLYSRNERVVVPGCQKPDMPCGSPKDAFIAALKHEMEVSGKWESIATAAIKAGDNTTYEFAQWYLREQVEEESKMRDFIFLIEHGIPTWELEHKAEDMLDAIA